MKTGQGIIAGLCLVKAAEAAFWQSPENQRLTFSMFSFPGRGKRQLLYGEPTPEDWETDIREAERAASGLAVATTLENYPNPLVNPAACRRWGEPESYICDPDGVLSRGERDRIEEELGTIRRKSYHQCGNENLPFMLGVAVVRQLPSGVDGNTFATELLDRWGLGHPGCHDGILLLYSKTENETVLKWKRGVEPRINFKIYGALQKEFHANVARMPTGKALELNVILVGQHLTLEILPPRQTPHLVVVLAITTLIGVAYAACAVTVLTEELGYK